MTNKRFGSWPSFNNKKVLLDGDPGQVIYRHGAVATDLRLKVWTGSQPSDLTGGTTFSIPAGYFSTVYTAHADCVRDTVNPQFATFAMVRNVTTTSLVVQCFESRTTNTLLLSQAEGLELATSSLTIMVTVFGVGP